MKWLSNNLIYIFVFSIPLSQNWSVKLLAACFILHFITSLKNGNYVFYLRKSGEVVTYLCVLALGLIHTEDIETGFRVLETSFGLFALPLIFNTIDDPSNRFIHNVFKSFIFGLLASCLICLGSAALNYYHTHDSGAFFYYQLVSIIGFQPTYLAYYLITAITYIIYNAYYELVKIRTIIWAVGACFFFTLLILTGGSTAYISLLLIFSFFILKYILEESTGNKKIVFIIVVLLLVSLFGVSSISYFNNSISLHSDYWERSHLWISALKANPNPILGVGTGDYKEVLNNYYQTHGMNEFVRDSYNSHNQFIQIYFSNGIMGLLALIILIGRPLYLSVRNQNTLGILLIFPFVIYGVTEVFLGRYQGVVFFALLHQIIMYQHYYSKPSFALNAS